MKSGEKLEITSAWIIVLKNNSQIILFQADDKSRFHTWTRPSNTFTRLWK